MTDMLIPVSASGTRPAGDEAHEVDGYLLCTGVDDVTHDVKTFTFGLPGGAPLRYLPGQYLTFRVPVDGDHVERCYTLSSSPTRPGQVAITVKRTPGGVVSTWLHDRLAVGDTIAARGPYGRFSCAVHPADRYLFLTAGSGITPAMSMLRALCDTADPADVVLVHCARTPDDIIFRDELEALAGERRVGLHVLCEDDSDRERWRGLRGRLTMPSLLQIAPDLLRREVFTCGPPAFMGAVRDWLVALGVDPSRSHEESFEIDGRGPSPVEAVDTGTSYRVELRRSGRIFECGSGTPILDAAARAGISMPSSCTEGVCGTCKATLLSGRVDMQHAGGISRREIEQHKVLPCCSTPLEDVVLDA